MMHEYFERTIQEIIDMPTEEFLTLCSDYLRLVELESLREAQMRYAQQITSDWRNRRGNG